MPHFGSTGLGVSGRYDQRSKGSVSQPPGFRRNTTLSKAAKSMTSSSNPAAAGTESSADQQCDKCSVSASHACEDDERQCSTTHSSSSVCKTISRNLGRAVCVFTPRNRIDDSETLATAAMLWPYVMVSTGCTATCGSSFLALTELMNFIECCCSGTAECAVGAY